MWPMMLRPGAGDVVISVGVTYIDCRWSLF